LVNVSIKKTSKLNGEVDAPPSKAYTHRALITSLLSKGVSKISNPLICNDTQATLQAIEAFGAKVDLHKKCWVVKGLEALEETRKPIDCQESGATLRFMIPVAALSPKASTFVFGSSLGNRPLMPLLKSLKKLKVESVLERKKEVFSVKILGGGIKGGKTSIRGDISSQFISGLLFACPKAEREVEINVITPLESRSYVQITLHALLEHDIKVHASNDLTQFQIPNNQEYKPCRQDIPGDFSSAAFLLAAGAITASRVKVRNLDVDTLQGDKAILNILEKMGVQLKIKESYVEVEGKKLESIDVDVRDIPDLVPVCAALACYANGTSKIYHAKRLRYKESNRLNSLSFELNKMGVKIRIVEDSLIVEGPCSTHGAIINPHNDHRIAMACAVIALGASSETTIKNSECVKKSYPKFFNDLHSLGANINGWKFDR
jgi:3-phosphoshikimate 1-carboxyvinyltransferase